MEMVYDTNNNNNNNNQMREQKMRLGPATSTFDDSIKINQLSGSSASLPPYSPIHQIPNRQLSHDEYTDSDDIAYAADVDDDDAMIGEGEDNDHSRIANASSLIDNKSVVNQQKELESSDSLDLMDTNLMSPTSRRRRRRIGFLIRNDSLHSDSSLYSSVDSLLEARKPDPEAILINLGFGPVESEDILSRIPKRFLKPSQVRGIDTEAFIRRLQLASSLHDNSVLGYRGLTGNPDVPPSSIVAKIMERFEVNQRKKSISAEQTL